MSSYTTQLRYVCESLIGLHKSVDRPSVDSVIKQASPILFGFPYPIYDETHRDELQEKIIRHYWTREIGQETVGAFRLRLQVKMTEIMPYYNKLYEAMASDFDVMGDTNYVRSHEEDGNDHIGGEHTSQNSGGVQATGRFLDTPQGNIEVLDDGYLTSASKSETIDNTKNIMTLNDDTHHNLKRKETVKGKVGSLSYGKLLQELKNGILNVDMMIIEALEPLFMGLW